MLIIRRLFYQLRSIHFLFLSMKGEYFLMDFFNQVVLVYLEEDNIQRAFFRVRPLLRRQGPLTPAQIAHFPDDGYLRIVPDKDEQHTFKERMRTMCGVCTLNLRDILPEANKIRTNKNYSPMRGENNQYIVYSDAVQPVPDDQFYEVVAPENVHDAVTPLVYTRVGGHINGPVVRETGEEAENAQKLPPDSTGLFSVMLPTGVEKLFYWPSTPEQVKEDLAQAALEKEKEAASAPAAAPLKEAPAVQKPRIAPPKAQPESQLAPQPEPVKPVPQPAPQPAPQVKEQLTALDRIKKMDGNLTASTNRLDARSAPIAPVEQPQRKLTGTPLYQSVVRRSAPVRSHNPLMEAVENQRMGSRYEAPGAQVLGTAQMRSVPNPVEQFKQALISVWQVGEAQRQTVETLMSMSGMREMVAKFLSVGDKDLTLAAMQAQLEDLEAERLMTLMQLDKIKENAQAAREDAAKTLTAQQAQTLENLKAETKHVREALEQLKSEREGLLEERDKALDALEELDTAETVLRLAPQKGTLCAINETLSQLEMSLKAAGFELSHDDACALLIVFLLSAGQFGLTCQVEADALDGARAFSHALGGVCGLEKQGKVRVYGGGDAPCFVLSTGTTLEEENPYTLIVIDQECAIAQRDFMLNPYPYFPLRSGDNLPMELPACAPIKTHMLRSEVLSKEGELPKEALTLLGALRGELAKAGCSLPLRLFAQLVHFVKISQTLMNGGIAAALDMGVMCYVLPYVRAANVDMSALREFCAGMPRTLEVLYKNA